MTKLTTDKIKSMMTSWLKQLDKVHLEHYVDFSEAQGRYISDEDLDEIREEFSCKHVKTLNEALDHIYDLWCDSSNWKRREKRKLKNEWSAWLGDPDWENKAWCIEKDLWIASGRNGPGPNVPIAPISEPHIDIIGGGDQALLRSHSGDVNEHRARECVYRLFIHTNDRIGDNYRLEVITTPEDDAVICWTVTED